MLQLMNRLGDRFAFSVVGPPPSAEFQAFLESSTHPIKLVKLREADSLDLRDLPVIGSTLRRLRPDMIHAQNPRGRFLAFPIARMLGIRTAYTFNMSLLIYGNSPFKQRLFR